MLNRPHINRDERKEWIIAELFRQHEYTPSQDMVLDVYDKGI